MSLIDQKLIILVEVWSLISGLQCKLVVWIYFFCADCLYLCILNNRRSLDHMHCKVCGQYFSAIWATWASLFDSNVKFPVHYENVHYAELQLSCTMVSSSLLLFPVSKGKAWMVIGVRGFLVQASLVFIEII